MTLNRIKIEWILFNFVQMFFGFFLPIILFVLLINNYPNPVLSNSECVLLSIFFLGWISICFVTKAIAGMLIIMMNTKD